jgi:hypothetical protein
MLELFAGYLEELAPFARKFIEIEIIFYADQLLKNSP